LFKILPIRSVVLLTYGRMDRIFSDYVLETLLFACLLIVSFLSCLFFCKAVFKWLSSVYRCSLSEMVKVLYSELIADCFCAGWCDSACRYLSVCVGFLYTWWPKVPSVFLETKMSKKKNFLLYLEWIFGLLRKIRNLRVRLCYVSPYHECVA